jgi:hypothetical protein
MAEPYRVGIGKKMPTFNQHIAGDCEALCRVWLKQSAVIPDPEENLVCLVLGHGFGAGFEKTPDQIKFP